MNEQLAEVIKCVVALVGACGVAIYALHRGYRVWFWSLWGGGGASPTVPRRRK